MSQQDAERSEADRLRGRQLTKQFLEGEVGALATEMSATLLKEQGGFQEMGEYVKREREDMGGLEATEEAAASPGSVLDERFYRRGGETYYCQVRRIPGESERGIVRWRWGNGPDGRRAVTGTHVSALGDSLLPKRPGYEPETELRLPFHEDQEVYVSWGGGGGHGCENYHVALPYGNAFAYDFKVRKGGRSYEGDGAENEDYYCYGMDVLAPAPGRVVATLDTVAENPTPGEYAGSSIPNYILIEHRSGEYSMFGHLRQGTVPFEQGEHVDQGDKIGECGNNGTSGAPHVHYQLQSKGALARDTKGLPATFSGYFTREGGYVERGEPTRGEYVRAKE